MRTAAEVWAETVCDTGIWAMTGAEEIAAFGRLLVPKMQAVIEGAIVDARRALIDDGWHSPGGEDAEALGIIRRAAALLKPEMTRIEAAVAEERARCATILREEGYLGESLLRIERGDEP